LRTVGLVLAALLPQLLKRAVYRWCFGYRVAPGAFVGFAFLDCERLVVEEGARIAHGVAFLGCGEVRVGKHVHLGSLNLFAGGDRIELDDYSHVRRLNFINAIRDHDCTNAPDSSFYLGWGAVVTAEHRIDFTDRVRNARCSILAGRGTSLWTHNIRTGRPVVIGDYCYVGSECRFSPGTGVPDCSIVGLGSVVTRLLDRSWSLYAGVPAEWKRPVRPDDFPMLFGQNRKDLPESELPKPPPEVLSNEAGRPAEGCRSS
jgi:acetyltransferase-like isoleucine patch superfamily enzyme